MSRRALLVATSAFRDEGLMKLAAPGHDVSDLHDVLADPEVGDFGIDLVVNADVATIRRMVERFFLVDADRDDLLLFFYSGHGLKDEAGRLYFAATDTSPSLLRSTGLPADFVNDVMATSRARQQVLVLDCCYSGAFTQGMTAKSDPSPGISDSLGKPMGRGRVVLAASNSVQYSFESVDPEANQARSLYTSALVDGLRTGEADLDGDGVVSANEWHDYALRRVRDANPNQQPRMWAFDLDSQPEVAHVFHPPEPAVVEDPEPAAVPKAAVAVEDAPSGLVDTSPVTSQADRAPPRPVTIALFAIGLVAALALAVVALMRESAAPPPAVAATTIPPATTQPSAEGTTSTAPATSTTELAPVTTRPVSGIPTREGTLEIGAGPKFAIATEDAVWFSLIDGAALARIASDLNVDQVPVGRHPVEPLFHNGQLWVPGRADGTITVVDVASSSGGPPIAIGADPDRPVFGGGKIWVALREADELVALDPATHGEVTRLAMPPAPLAPAVAQAWLWVVSRGEDGEPGYLTAIDPFNPAPSEPLFELGPDPYQPVVVGGNVWISDRLDGSIRIVDPLRQEVVEILEVGAELLRMGVGGAALSRMEIVGDQAWMSAIDGTYVVVVDTSTYDISPIETGFYTRRPILHDGAMWAVALEAETIVRIDPETKEVIMPIPLGGSPDVPISAHGRLWVPDRDGSVVTVFGG